METLLISGVGICAVALVASTIALILLLLSQRRLEASQSQFGVVATGVSAEVARLATAMSTDLGKVMAWLQKLSVQSDAAAKSNNQAAGVSADSLRKSVVDLERILQDHVQQSQARFESAIRQLSAITDSFNTTSLEYGKLNAENATKQNTFLNETLMGLVRENGAAMIRGAEGMRKHVQDLQDIATSFATNLQGGQEQTLGRVAQLLERFESLVEKFKAESGKHHSDHRDLVRMTGQQLAVMIEGRTKEFRTLLDEYQGTLGKVAESLKVEIQTVTGGLSDLKQSLEEAVRF